MSDLAPCPSVLSPKARKSETGTPHWLTPEISTPTPVLPVAAATSSRCGLSNMSLLMQMVPRVMAPWHEGALLLWAASKLGLNMHPSGQIHFMDAKMPAEIGRAVRL